MSCSNAAIWTAYGFVKGDIFVVVSTDKIHYKCKPTIYQFAKDLQNIFLTFLKNLNLNFKPIQYFLCKYIDKIKQGNKSQL